MGMTIDATLAAAIIAAFASIVVAIITTRNNKRADERERRDEEYRKKQDQLEKERAERDLAVYNLLFADTNATDVLLRIALGEKVNGNVEEAIDRIKNAKDHFNDMANKHLIKLG